MIFIIVSDHKNSHTESYGFELDLTAFMYGKKRFAVLTTGLLI